MRLSITLATALVLLPAAARAQPEARERSVPARAAPGDGPAAAGQTNNDEPVLVEELFFTSAPQKPFYETWWFWTAIGITVLGVTLAIVVGVTTDHPRTTRADLALSF